VRIYLTLALLAGLSLCAESRVVVAGRDVVMWKPAGAAPSSGFPVVIFSHGFLGCGTQSKFLTEALAGAGYLVLAPNHQDALCGKGGFPKAEESFLKAENWTDATYRDRADDLRAILDALFAAKSFHDVPVDRRRVGLAGHSLGGYTVLGLAGAWPSWKDSRVKAVLALSPYCEPYVLKGDLAHLKIPAMYQGGTLDLGITPTVRQDGGAYDSSGAPKYYVEFRGAGHFAWTDLSRKFQAVIAEYSVAFFDRYLKNSAQALESLTVKPLPAQVSALRSDPR
jgi:predicted dienelactone hydrolase